MNIEKARFNMIEQQIRPWNVLDLDVLELLTIAHREEFVPVAYKNLAFSDVEIPLSDQHDVAMFTPKMEARLLQEAQVKKHEQVLEIGTGSGYMAALLSYKARQVTTIEIDPALFAFAEKNLATAGIKNVEVSLGNGAQGDLASKRYDVIMISASLPVLPQIFLTQLNEGGRIIAIIGNPPVMQVQRITRLSADSYRTVDLFETNVRPLREISPISHFTF